MKKLNDKAFIKDASERKPTKVDKAALKSALNPSTSIGSLFDRVADMFDGQNVDYMQLAREIVNFSGMGDPQESMRAVMTVAQQNPAVDPDKLMKIVTELASTKRTLPMAAQMDVMAPSMGVSQPQPALKAALNPAVAAEQLSDRLAAEQHADDPFVDFANGMIAFEDLFSAVKAANPDKSAQIDQIWQQYQLSLSTLPPDSTEDFEFVETAMAQLEALVGYNPRTAQLDVMAPAMGVTAPQPKPSLKPLHDGMWLPRDIKKHYRKLRSMGYGINDADMAVDDVIRQGAGGNGAEDARVRDFLYRLWYATISTKPHEESLYKLANALYTAQAAPPAAPGTPPAPGAPTADPMATPPAVDPMADAMPGAEPEMSLADAVQQLDEASKIVVEKVQNGEALDSAGEEMIPELPMDTGSTPAPSPKIAQDTKHKPSIMERGDPTLNKQYMDKLKDPQFMRDEQERVQELGKQTPKPKITFNPVKDQKGRSVYKPSTKSDSSMSSGSPRGLGYNEAPKGIAEEHGTDVAELLKIRNEAQTLFNTERKMGPPSFYSPEMMAQNDFIGQTGMNKKDVVRYKEAIPRTILFKLEQSMGDWSQLSEQEMRTAHDAMMQLYLADKGARRDLMKMIDRPVNPAGGKPVEKSPVQPKSAPAVKSKSEDREQINKNLQVMKDRMKTLMKQMKQSVDQEAKDYYHDLYGEQGDMMTRDRVAEIVDSVEDVFMQHGLDHKSPRFAKIVSFVADNEDVDQTSKYAQAMVVADDKFASFLDKLLVNHVLTTNADSAFANGEIPSSAKASFFVSAMHRSGTKDRVLKFVADKMKTPKPKGQPDDAVDVEAFGDEPGESDPQPHNAHINFEIDDMFIKGVYTHVQLSWDLDGDTEDKSEHGVMQACISFIKGLESTKEPRDLGVVGRVHFEDFDMDAGVAEVFFRSNKAGDNAHVFREE